MYSEAKKPVAQKRKLVTAIPGPKSAELIKRRGEAVSASLGTAFPVFIDHAQGAIIVDVDGNSILDLGAGIAVLNVGHSQSRVTERVKTAIDAFSHTCFMVVPYTGYVEVCEALNRLTPGKFKKKSALFNSGAEALENAVKIARNYTKRQAVVVFEHGYHGRTNLTMALTAKNMPYKEGFGPFAPEVYRVPMPYSFHWVGDQATITQDAIEMITHKIDKEIGAHNVAAIIIEPIQGEGGFIVPPKGFLPALSKYSTDNGIIFIADEVQTGFARTGNMFAVENENVVPDMIVTAKGIAGGLPLAGVTGRAEIMDSVHVSGLGGTYGGNPLACAAALGVFETMEAEKLVERANHIGKILGDALRTLQSKYSVIGEVRGRGAMQAIELVEPGTKTPNSAAMSAVVKYCQSKGVLVLTAGTYSNVVRFLPPIVITDELLKDALSVLDEAFASL